MMKTVLWTYRVVYCAFLTLLLVVLLHRLPIGESLRPFEIPLFWALIASLALGLYSATAFTRIPEWLSWAATFLVCALLVWYTWFSLGAPFVLHELHTFNSVEAAKEIRTHRDQSFIATAIMLGFFMLLPVLHHFNQRRSHIASGRVAPGSFTPRRSQNRT